MINEIIKQLKPLINGRLIYLSQYGSHLYGLNTENSDLDFRGVYIPTLDDTILKKDKDEINTELYIDKQVIEEYVPDEHCKGYFISQKVDIKIFSLRKFIQLCSKAYTNALDLLFSISKRTDIEQYMYLDNRPHDHSYSIFEQIFYNRDKLINTDRLESPISYAFKQATKYGLKGERLKVLLEVKELLDTGSIQFPLKDKDFLLAIKLGKVERKDIDEFFNKELSEILERVQKNELNWKYDEEFWNDFILKEIKNV